MEYITIFNSILFALITWVWSSRNWINSLIKFTFFAATIINIFVAFNQFGFIIKI